MVVYQLITVVINGINMLEYVPMHIKRSYSSNREGYREHYKKSVPVLTQVSYLGKPYPLILDEEVVCIYVH